MKPSADQAATARRAGKAVGFALFLTALAVPPALAADRALLDIIGFSDDGRYFAFEEFGVQDGSGFPYSTIFVVDVANDEWAAPPVRVRIDDEGSTLADARAASLDEAASLIGKLDITRPADVIAMFADGEAGDGQTLDFAMPGYGPGALQAAQTLALETFPAGSPEPCADYLGEPALGFALTLANDDGISELHRDGDTLPRSRGCPTAYRVYAVVVPFEHGPESGVVIVSVYPFGFEGPDRRFLALPLAP